MKAAILAAGVALLAGLSYSVFGRLMLDSSSAVVDPMVESNHAHVAALGQLQEPPVPASGNLSPSRRVAARESSAVADGLPGVTYLPIDQQDLPNEIKDRLKSAARALNESGSLSGGKPTHEFALVDHFAQQLRERGWENLMRELAIIPADLAFALGQGFALVGADVQGKDIPQMGRTGFFQVFRKSDEWAELSEEQLDILTGDGTLISSELVNGQVGHHPATVEQLRAEDGAPLVNVEWVVNDRILSLSTRNMPVGRALELARQISAQSEALPHGGWSRPYAYDQENPLHRVTRARIAASKVTGR